MIATKNHATEAELSAQEEHEVRARLYLAKRAARIADNNKMVNSLFAGHFASWTAAEAAALQTPKKGKRGRAVATAASAAPQRKSRRLATAPAEHDHEEITDNLREGALAPEIYGVPELNALGTCVRPYHHYMVKEGRLPFKKDVDTKTSSYSLFWTNVGTETAKASGATCHWCRQKCSALKTTCSAEGCGVRICGPCLQIRFGECLFETIGPAAAAAVAAAAAAVAARKRIGPDATAAAIIAVAVAAAASGGAGRTAAGSVKAGRSSKGSKADGGKAGIGGGGCSVAATATAAPAGWLCPVCRGICNCSSAGCMRIRRGWASTGSLQPQAEAYGAESAAHFLVFRAIDGVVLALVEALRKDDMGRMRAQLKICARMSLETPVRTDAFLRSPGMKASDCRHPDEVLFQNGSAPAAVVARLIDLRRQARAAVGEEERSVEAMAAAAAADDDETEDEE
ncbi:unnamed protein product [Phaeothamnion confervicola]